MWKFSNVDISDVVSSRERSSFSEQELETLANLIVEMEGLIHPAILKRAGFEKGYERFQVIYGDLEYHASVLAKQKNPDIEMINAFIIDPASEDIALRQLEVFLKTDDNPILSISNDSGNNSPGELEIEKRFQEFQVAIRQEFQVAIRQEIQKLREEYQEAIRAIEPKIIVPPPDPKPPSKLSIVEVLNTYSEQKLASMGFGKAMAKKIVQQRPFTSFSDLRGKVTGQWKIDAIVSFIDSYDQAIDG
jgi:ParB family transcriptional regulator, chromosome partitioning protein